MERLADGGAVNRRVADDGGSHAGRAIGEIARIGVIRVREARRVARKEQDGDLILSETLRGAEGGVGDVGPGADGDSRELLDGEHRAVEVDLELRREPRLPLVHDEDRVADPLRLRGGVDLGRVELTAVRGVLPERVEAWVDARGVAIAAVDRARVGERPGVAAPLFALLE